MKKTVVLVIVLCMLCVSMTGAVSSINTKNDNISYINQTQDPVEEFRSHISTQQATNQLASTAERFFNSKQEDYKPAKQDLESDAYIPWTNNYKGDILEWYIRIKYNGEEFLKEVPITILDFQEQFLKHPEYGKTLKFDVDDDPEDDILVIIGFYWSIIRYPNTDQDYKSLETRLRVRQLSEGGYLDDPDGEFECWSELHVNVGLIKESARSRSTFGSLLQDRLKNGIFGKVIQRILEKNNFPILQNLFNKLTKDEGDDIQPLDTDDDYLSIGAGYGSPLGEEIPQLVEKRFSFAKGLKWRDGSIFEPAIFQHMMSPGNEILGNEVIELLYGFRSYQASTQTLKFDVGFNVGFEPAVNLKTKFIPRDAYLAYFLNIPTGNNWGGWTPRSQPTEISFTADIKTGSGQDLPKLTLVLDKIDDDLAGSSTKWFSFDITGINGFKYTASHRFNVGIIVDVPGLFTEKVEVKGIPTSLTAEWGIDDITFVINQNQFYAKLGLYSELTMSSDIDKVTVFYPKFEGSEDAPDSPILDIKNIPSSQRIDVDGDLDLQNNSNILTVESEAGVTMSSSSNIAVISLYYPKADWYDDEDTKFLDIPNGLPGSASAGVDAQLRVNLDDIMDPDNRIYGNIEHGFTSNIEQVDIFLPSEQETPILRFTDVPSFAQTQGELYWAQLKGYGFSTRNSQNKDPIEVNLLFGDYKLYNKLEIRDGQIYTRFHVNQDGYFELDTTKKMFKNDLRFYNFDNGDQLLLYVEDVSANGFEAAWDIDTSGDQLEIEELVFDGTLEIINDLEIDITFVGKVVSFDIDWDVGEQGNFEIEIAQDEDVTIDFSDVFDDPDDNWDINGFITLDNTISFDMDWKLDLGENAQNPGYIKINKDSAGDNILEFEFEFIYTNPDNGHEYGIDIYMYQPAFYMDLEWYFDDDDPIPPYVYVWLDLYIGATIFDGDLIWTNQQGTTYTIALEDYLP